MGFTTEVLSVSDVNYLLRTVTDTVPLNLRKALLHYSTYSFPIGGFHLVILILDLLVMFVCLGWISYKIWDSSVVWLAFQPVL